jgi:hypothetical protein
MPLQFFQDNQAAAESIAQNDLQNDDENQDAIGPHNHMSNGADDRIQGVAKLVGNLFLVDFSVHGDLLEV